MKKLVTDALPALLTAMGFAAFAEVLLRRRSRGILAWNESFLIGAAAATTLLFPLSVLLPRGALEAIGIIVALSTLLRLLPTRSNQSTAASIGQARDPLATCLVVLIVLFTAAWIFIDLRAPFAWDGFQIWATKGFLLFHDHALKPEMWPGSVNEGRLGRTVNYPALVPLFEALVSKLRGSFDFLALKPIFALFFVSVLLSTYRAARSAASRRTALGATLLLALLPTWTSRQSAGGNADMPQAAYVAALAAAWMEESESASSWGSPIPWLLGALVSVKPEGAVLLGIACLAGLTANVTGEGLWSRLRRNWRGAAVVVAFAASRIGYLGWTAIADQTFGPINGESILRGGGRLGLVAQLCTQELLKVPVWGLLWPAFALCAGLLLVRGEPNARILAAATALSLLAYSGIFLFTNWPVALHVAQAYRRLITQLAPAAVVTLVAAFGISWTKASDAGPRAR